MNDTRHAARHRLAEFGALLADPTRAGMLLALLDGSVRPAGELARMADVSASTASGHLRRLVEGGLLAVVDQGRHRYYRLADPHVAQQLEVLAVGRERPRAPPPAAGGVMALARTCYDHLAGRLGVALFEALRADGGLELDADAVRLADRGARRLREVGLLAATDDDVGALAGRACVDWTERRFHLAGPLGAHLTRALFDADWLRRRDGHRALILTAAGRRQLARLGVDTRATG